MRGVRRGHQTVCLNQESMGYQYEGGFAEFMVVPPSVLAVDGMNRVPEGVGADEASVTEPLACVLNGQELAGVGAGDVVAVFGAGPIGCLHVRLARSRGAARIIMIEVNRERLAAGRRPGPARTTPSAPRTATSSSRSASSPTAAARTW